MIKPMLFKMFSFIPPFSKERGWARFRGWASSICIFIVSGILMKISIGNSVPVPFL